MTRFTGATGTEFVQVPGTHRFQPAPCRRTEYEVLADDAKTRDPMEPVYCRQCGDHSSSHDY